MPGDARRETHRRAAAERSTCRPGSPMATPRGSQGRAALLVLSAPRGASAVQLHELAWAEGTRRCVSRDPGRRCRQRGRPGMDARTVDPRRDRGEPSSALGARFVVPGDDEYVPVFLELQSRPAGRPVRDGSVPAGLRRRRRGRRGPQLLVARQRDGHGHRVGLGGAGACVASGAARGIDAASHRGALAAGGHEHRGARLGDRPPVPEGAARSSWTGSRRRARSSASTRPESQAEPFRFPARNRLVAALGRALVVVEGAHGSGSMISVEHALDLGRDVFAVPGTGHQPARRGAAGADPRGRNDDPWRRRPARGPRVRPPGSLFAPPPDLPGDEAQVFEPWRASAGRCDRPATGVSIAAAVTALLSLELKGLVRNVGGSYERRLVVRRSCRYERATPPPSATARIPCVARCRTAAARHGAVRPDDELPPSEAE